MRQEKKMVSYDNTGLSKSPRFLKALEKLGWWGGISWGIHMKQQISDWICPEYTICPVSGNNLT